MRSDSRGVIAVMLVTAVSGLTLGGEPVVKLVAPKHLDRHQPVVRDAEEKTAGPRPTRDQPVPVASESSPDAAGEGRDSGPRRGTSSSIRQAQAFAPRVQPVAPVVDLPEEPMPVARRAAIQRPRMPVVKDADAAAGRPGGKAPSTPNLPPVIDAYEYRMQQQRLTHPPGLAKELAHLRQGTQLRALKQSVEIAPPSSGVPGKSREDRHALEIPVNPPLRRAKAAGRATKLRPLGAIARSAATLSRSTSAKATQQSPSGPPVVVDGEPVDSETLGFPKFDRAFAPIHQLSIDTRPPEGKVPTDLARANFQRAGDVFHPVGASRQWVLRNYAWVAPGTFHWPLYFEDANVERYGYHWGCAQPLFSAAHFFGRLPLLPYMHGAWPCHECMYTLGHYRPGDCVAYRCSRLPWSLRGALYEAGAAVGLVYLIP